MSSSGKLSLPSLLWGLHISLTQLSSPGCNGLRNGAGTHKKGEAQGQEVGRQSEWKGNCQDTDDLPRFLRGQGHRDGTAL